MGCHTWFYKNIHRTIEEARIVALSECDKILNKFKTLQIEGSKILSKEEVNHVVLVYERVKTFIQKGLFKGNGLSDLQEIALCLYINNNFYFCTDDMPHDIFRIGSYPEDILLSMNDTLKFCKSTNIELDKEQIKQLNEFWDNNPDGLIRFG